MTLKVQMSVNILVTILGYLGQNKVMKLRFVQRVLPWAFFLSLVFQFLGLAQNDSSSANSKEILNMSELLKHFQQQEQIILYLN